MGDDGRISVCAQAHPVNRWLLHPLAVPYLRIDDAPPVRLRWSVPRTFGGLGRGRHRAEFTMRYLGFRRPITRTVIEVAPAAGEQVSYRIRNGWMNQDPFEFHRVDARDQV